MAERKDSSSYMDGVPVKISEKYKRRPLIRLPVHCQNCTPGPALYEEYDFNREKLVLEKMIEWKKLRDEAALKMDEKAARWQEEQAKEKFNKLSLEENESTLGAEVNGEISILKPTNFIQPEKETSAKNYWHHSNSFKISEFETDNSSPFDNMELKTINDMEILASVLSCNASAVTSATITPAPCNHYNVPNGTAWNSWNAYGTYSSPHYYESSHSTSSVLTNPLYSNDPAFHSAYVATPFSSNSHNYPAVGAQANNLPYQPAVHDSFPSRNVQSQKTNSKSVPDLVLELEKELKENRLNENVRRKTKTPPPRRSVKTSAGLEDWKPWPDLESPRRNSSDDVLAVNVPPIAKTINEMGFPMDRVLRSLEKFKGDDKKVIEFLLQVQRLEERKLNGELVERALHSNNYNEKETVRHLEALAVLMDLGFDIDRAEKALLDSRNDCNIALDRLIT